MSQNKACTCFNIKTGLKEAIEKYNKEAEIKELKKFSYYEDIVTYAQIGSDAEFLQQETVTKGEPFQSALEILFDVLKALESKTKKPTKRKRPAPPSKSKL